MIFAVKNTGGYFKNIFHVLFGNKTWVGFIQSSDGISQDELRHGVLNPADGTGIGSPDAATSTRLNALYARDYNVNKDIRIIMKSLSQLGRQ